jgi:hypothetical protein
MLIGYLAVAAGQVSRRGARAGADQEGQVISGQIELMYPAPQACEWALPRVVHASAFSAWRLTPAAGSTAGESGIEYARELAQSILPAMVEAGLVVVMVFLLVAAANAVGHHEKTTARPARAVFPGYFRAGACGPGSVWLGRDGATVIVVDVAARERGDEPK